MPRSHGVGAKEFVNTLCEGWPSRFVRTGKEPGVFVDTNALELRFSPELELPDPSELLLELVPDDELPVVVPLPTALVPEVPGDIEPLVPGDAEPLVPIDRVDPGVGVVVEPSPSLAPMAPAPKPTP